MTLERRTNGRADVSNKIINILKNDEHMLRLLKYDYLDSFEEFQDVLSPSLPNIVGSSNHHRIASEHIVNTVKEDDIKSIKTCMIFIHLGKRRPVFSNYMLAKQEILIDILVHNDFQENDFRMDDICDRLDYLLVHERITMGKMEISTPIPMEAPKEYYRFQMKYTYWTSKK